MEGVNRFALIVRPKRRYLEWANSLDDGPRLTIEELPSLTEVYLVDATDSERDRETLIDEYADEIWEQQLEQWWTDDSDWPANRTPHLLRDWFDITFVEMVFDADPDVEWSESALLDGELTDDELSELEMRTCQWCGKVGDPEDAIVTLSLTLPEGDPLRGSSVPIVPLEVAGRLRMAVAAREGSPMAREGKDLLLAFCSDACARSMREAIMRERAALLS